MAHDKSTVRRLLDEVRAAGRSSAFVALDEHGSPAHAYSTEIPVAVLGARRRAHRGRLTQARAVHELRTNFLR